MANLDLPSPGKMGKWRGFFQFNSFIFYFFGGGGGAGDGDLLFRFILSKRLELNV